MTTLKDARVMSWVLNDLVRDLADSERLVALQHFLKRQLHRQVGG